MSDNKPFTDSELRQAVALFYDGSEAPQVSAKGEGLEAEQIIAIARQHKVPMCENPGLVQILSTIELGDHIPNALYVCIAQILSFAYQLQDKTPKDA